MIALRLDGYEPATVKKMEAALKKRVWKGFWHEYLQILLEMRNNALNKDTGGYFGNERVAYAYAATRDRKKMLEYLFKAYEERDPDLVTIKMSRVYDFLSGDPRYQELIKKIGLPDHATDKNDSTRP